MIQGQAIVHTVAWARVHESREPEAPIQNAAVRENCRLRQPRRARGVDIERVIRKFYAAAFAFGKRCCGKMHEFGLDASITVAMDEDFCGNAAPRECASASIAVFFGGNDQAW